MKCESFKESDRREAPGVIILHKKTTTNSQLCNEIQNY
jgi:hypothetical protein